MKHLATIQQEFIANWWVSLSLDQKHKYLALHPKSRQKLTNTIINQSYLAKKLTNEYKKLIPKLLRPRNDLETVIYMLDSVTEKNKSLPQIGFQFNPKKDDMQTIGAYNPIDDRISIHIDELPKNKLDADIELHAYFTLLEKTLQHELIHRQQWLRIKNNTKDLPARDKEFLSHFTNEKPSLYDEIMYKFVNSPHESREDYLSEPQELMTHANDAVQEMKSNHFSYEKMRDFLRHPEKMKFWDSTTVWDYKKQFGLGHPVFNKFLKYMYRYLS
ncbi:MAG: hypothetical protein Q7R33_07950 [Nitrosarchaeum sp.]|nr:hypothetical protein [Nitrosarchaeum sp.]